MNIKRVMRRVFAGLLLSTVPTLHLMADLDEYAWQYRPLLLFAASDQDSFLRQALEEIKARDCEMDDRDIVVGVVLTVGSSTIDDNVISKHRAQALRHRFGTDVNQFSAILVGKDGTEKLRVLEPPDLDQLFALIDGMPMRQNEMTQRVSPCR